MLGRVYVQIGKHQEAIASFETALQHSRNREALAPLAQAYALSGESAKARALLRELTTPSAERYVPAPLVALVYIGLAEFETALDWLEKGLAERSYWMVFLKTDPVFDPLRLHSRFIHLLAELGWRH
jgi:cytochrome c-type biogenesis protein CcmH/NrfG